jgi:hypothetical protein
MSEEIPILDPTNYHGLDLTESADRVLGRIDEAMRHLGYPPSMVGIGTHAYAEVLSVALRKKFPNVTPSDPTTYLSGLGIQVLWFAPGEPGAATGSGRTPGATVTLSPGTGLVIWPAVGRPRVDWDAVRNG